MPRRDAAGGPLTGHARPAGARRLRRRAYILQFFLAARRLPSGWKPNPLPVVAEPGPPPSPANTAAYRHDNLRGRVVVVTGGFRDLGATIAHVLGTAGAHIVIAELRPRGIKVCALVAGGMRTPFRLDRFADIDTNLLQNPAGVARAVRFVLTWPEETVIPALMVLPMRESSWP